MATTISPSDQAADLLHIVPETMAKVSDTGNNKDVYSNGFSTKSSGLLPNKELNQKKHGYNYSAQKKYYGCFYPQAYQYYPRYGYDMNYASGKTNNNTPYLGLSGSGYTESMYSMYEPYMTGYGYGYDSYGYSSYKYTPNWYAFNNGYKTKGYYGYGKENADWLNELNRGPRAKGVKTGQPETIKDGSVPDSKEYNKEDFSDAYSSNAKLFVIKSYSEDDIHKSIKYNVWSSTPNGNEKLNAAYNEAARDKSSCPVFLIFSVNTSGQFIGLAEMTGPVDFNQTVEYWQQDKWVGCFPVKWHIVKDIPNSSLRHITLENNENRPVTNSRDTQEVKMEQAVKVIKIFKEHVSKTCILDDFVFYESREKIIKDGKKKHQQYKKQQALAGSEKKATPKETSVITEVVEEISQNGVVEVASAC